MATKKSLRRTRIRLGIRRKINGTSQRPRLSVYKSNRAIYAQVIDDTSGHTLSAATSFELGKKSNATLESSKEVGKQIAERALAAGIKTVVFDRGGYHYHGKIKALADGARGGGLKF